MSEPRPSPTIVPSVAVMQSARGPLVANYLIPLDRLRLYAWTTSDPLDADNGVTVVVPAGTGGAVGAWYDVPADDKGEDLIDGASIIFPSGNAYRRLAPSTLTANGGCTLGITVGGTETVRAGHSIWFALADTGSFAYTIVNGGPAGGTLGVKPRDVSAWLWAWFNGTDWECRGSGLMLPTA